MMSNFDISSEEGAVSRVFVGNLQSDITSKQDLTNKFKRYGKVMGVAIHRGYAFVQYSSVSEAELAVKGEHDTMFRGKRLDCNIAADKKNRRYEADRKSDDRDRNRKYSRERDRGASEYSRDRDFERYPEYDRGPPRRDRSPLRDAYDEPYRDRAALRRDEPPRRERDRDPYYDDVYRRESRRDPLDPYARPSTRDRYDAPLERREPGIRDDPYRDSREFARERDDPYRRDPYDRDYDRRLPAAAPLPAPPAAMDEFEKPIDAEILVVDKQQRGYAEIVERRLKEQALNVGMIFLSPELTMMKALEDVTRRDVLYAIVITSQHELHRSVTLNILHGTPQEHRNMPLEDAMKLVVKNFDSYMQALREKTKGIPAEKGLDPKGARLPAVGSEAINELTMPQLLNLLADGRQLTIPELTRVISHLSDIRQKMMVLEGVAPSSITGDAPVPSNAPQGVPPVPSNTEELQAKILNTISSAGAVPNAGPLKSNQAAAAPDITKKVGQPKPTPAGDMPAANLNLDNPNIQKALNSLIQIKPGVLRSLVGSTATETNPTMVTADSQNRSSESMMSRQDQQHMNVDQSQVQQQQHHQQLMMQDQYQQYQQNQQNHHHQQQQQQFMQQQQFNQQPQMPFQPQQPFNGPVQRFSMAQQQAQMQANYQQQQQQQQMFYGMGQRY